MNVDEAAAMLQNQQFQTAQPMVWADLGCGKGTFTLALATLLWPGSLVYAIDHDAAALQHIPSVYQQVSIEKHKADFINDPLPFTKINGILMANALHYVQDKNAFFQKAIAYLNTDGCFLIVEYNTDDPVPVWVPFPVSFNRLQMMMRNMGFNTARHLNERASVYGHAPMYAAIVSR